MKYRRLGGTDLDVSVICLGPMRAAAKEPGNDEKSRLGEAALRAALDAGVNFIHSSYEYGTRWMMNRVLADHPKRSELHHVIKLPVPDFADGDRFDAGKFRLRVEEADLVGIIGPNGSGKTSVCDAVRAAITGATMPPGFLKKACLNRKPIN